MSLDQLSTATKVFLGAGIALLIVSFFKWNQVEIPIVGDVSYGSGWAGIFGFLFGIALVLSLVWVLLPLFNVQIPELPIDRALVGPIFAAVAVVCGALRWLTTPSYNGVSVPDGVDVGRTAWAWLGLILLIVFAVGAFLRWQEEKNAPAAETPAA